MKTIPETEAGFQAAVIDLAQWHRWLVHHQRPGRNSDGSWRSQIQGNAGFPDLVLARDGRLVIAELKSEKGVVSPQQRTWLTCLDSVYRASAGIAETYLWRPRHWDEIESVLC